MFIYSISSISPDFTVKIEAAVNLPEKPLSFRKKISTSLNGSLFLVADLRGDIFFVKTDEETL